MLVYMFYIFVKTVRWLRTYDVDNYLKANLIARITVGTMLFPQAMSYAHLAGLHPIYGLCKFLQLWKETLSS